MRERAAGTNVGVLPRRCSRWLVVPLTLAAATLTAQTRLEFHLLPAVSSGPLDPDWSPDGETLAFAMRGDVWTLPAAGGEAVALTSGPAYYHEPAFRPDGLALAVVMEVGGDFELALLDAGGRTPPRRLTHHAGLDLQPAWAPDGESLYFASRRRRDLDIYRLELATGRVTPVVSRPGHDFQPAVSPDGTRLVFVSRVEGRLGSGGIWSVRLPDGEPELIHDEESSYRLKPSFSPDGADLVFVSDAAGSNDVAIVPAGGGNRVRLTEDPLDELDPSWSSDGSTIAFVSNHEGPTALYTLAAGGGPRAAWRRVGTSKRRSRVATGRLRGRVVGADGETTPARILLTAADGRAYAEDGGFPRLSWATNTPYFHSDGTFEVEVPEGEVRLEAMRGFEYAGRQPGETIRLAGDAPARLRVRLRVASIAPLAEAELIVNGRVAHTWPLGRARGPTELEAAIELPGSGWVAARAAGPPSRFVGDAFPFAQTSPVHVEREGEPYASAEDARFLLATVDELWRLVEARDTWTTAEQKRAYRDGVEQAREVYRRIIEGAGR